MIFIHVAWKYDSSAYRFIGKQVSWTLHSHCYHRYQCNQCNDCNQGLSWTLHWPWYHYKKCKTSVTKIHLKSSIASVNTGVTIVQCSQYWETTVMTCHCLDLLSWSAIYSRQFCLEVQHIWGRPVLKCYIPTTPDRHGFKCHIFQAEGITFLCSWICHQRPLFLTDHICRLIGWSFKTDSTAEHIQVL